MKRRVLIFGCGGHSRSVVDVLLSYEPHIEVVFIDERARENEKIFGFDIVAAASIDDDDYFFALGNNEERKMKYDRIGKAGLISIISPKAYLGREAALGQGVFVGNFSHVGPECAIGDNTVLNNGSIVEHEVKIGKHSHIGPNAVISGRCDIGDQVFIGVGATVKDRVKICSNVIVGAGAVIVKDIVEPGIYVGCPGKILNKEERK